MSEPQQITCARIALRIHGGIMRDENGCACEHCVALRELIDMVRAQGLGEPPDATMLEASPAVSRVELIDHRLNAPRGGRVFSAWDAKVALAYQDNGRTLKVFLSDRGAGHPERET